MFSVTVTNSPPQTNSPPTFTSVARGSNGVRLTFSVPLGTNYIVQFVNSLANVWSNLASPQMATTNPNTFLDPFPLPAARFYRIFIPGAGTNNLTTNRYDNDSPLPIPDTNTVNSSMFVTNLSGTISNVTISLYVTHTFDGDLQMTLISPDNTSVPLVLNRGGGGDNFGASCSPDSSRTTFTDSAGISIVSGAAPFVGSFRPESPLSAFAGKPPSQRNGTWRLQISDTVFSDTGTLNCWSLTILTGP